MNKSNIDKLNERRKENPSPQKIFRAEKMTNTEKTEHKSYGVKRVAKSTTIRTTLSTKYKINSLVNMNDAKSSDELISRLIEDYVSKLPADKKRHYKTSLEFYEKSNPSFDLVEVD